MRYSYIGTEHLILGLLGANPPSAGARALIALGVDADSFRADAMQDKRGVQPEQANGQIPFSPRARACIEDALAVALSYGCNYVATEHLLLSIVRTTSFAKTLLENRAITVEDVKREVELQGRKPPLGQATASGWVDVDAEYPEHPRLRAAKRTQPRKLWITKMPTSETHIVLQDRHEVADARRAGWRVSLFEEVLDGE